MPQAMYSIDSSEIHDALKRKGYGIDACRGFAFRLAVKQKVTFEHNGKSKSAMEFVPVGGPTPAQLSDIRLTSRDVPHAVQRIEAIAFSRPEPMPPTASEGGGGVDMTAVMHAIDNRIAAKLSPIEQALAAISKAVGVLKAPEPPKPALPPEDEPVLAAPLVSTKPFEGEMPKKRGWPKGKPRGKRSPKVATPA